MVNNFFRLLCRSSKISLLHFHGVQEKPFIQDQYQEEIGVLNHHLLVATVRPRYFQINEQVGQGGHILC